VPEELVRETGSAARAFIDLPESEKLALAEGEQVLGLPAYRPLRSERLAASLGQTTPGDLKESLDWGPAVLGYGWPGHPPELRRLFEDYLEALSGLGGQLRHVFALALDLSLLADGLTQTAIADQLVISPATVGTHIQRIIGKLDVHSRAEAVAFAHRHGLKEAVERQLVAAGAA
jgi:hypothetical protein